MATTGDRGGAAAAPAATTPAHATPPGTGTTAHATAPGVGTSRWAGRTEVGELITELYETAAMVRARGESVAREAGQSQARWQVLYSLVDGELTVPVLARRLGFTRQSVQRVVDLLVAEGLLVATSNPAHRRSPLFGLTAVGHRRLGRINDAAQGWHAEVRAGLGPDERQRLRGALASLRAVAAPPRRASPALASPRRASRALAPPRRGSPTSPAAR